MLLTSFKFELILEGVLSTNNIHQRLRERECCGSKKTNSNDTVQRPRFYEVMRGSLYDRL